MMIVSLLLLITSAYWVNSQQAADWSIHLYPLKPGRVRCGPHEHYNNCGSSCPRTCHSPPYEACIKRCNPGCHCNMGYVRSDSGSCILRRKCQKHHRGPPKPSY